jgi:hypothetical protein
MPLVYPIKIRFEDKLIIGLISPHLRMDFITRYLDSTKKFSSTPLTLTADTLEMETLQIVIEEYVKWLKSNNYVLRMPEHSRIDFLQPGEQWINVQLNIEIKKGPVEHISKAFGILLFLTTAALGEFSFIMAARFNKVSYAKIILPILTDFIMAAVIYVYSGTAANIDIKGKELDDWWHNKIVSPTEIELEEENHSLLSSWGLSRLMLHTLPLLYTVFKYIGYWQSMMSMRDEVKSLNLDDQVISPKFVYNFAIVGTSIGAAYTIAQCTSLSLQATNVLKNLLDRCYNLYVEKVSCIKKQNYVEVLATDEDEELKDADNFSTTVGDVDANTEIVLSSSFDIERHVENNSKEPEEKHTIFFINEVVYNNLLINKQGLLNEVFQRGGVKAVQDIINLGEDTDVVIAILETVEQYGIEHVLNIFFEDLINKSTIQDFDKEILQIKEIARELDIEHIFFLDNDKGIDFIQTVANNFSQEALIRILELGKDQSIVEQILLEVDLQGIDKVMNLLFNNNKIDTINYLENIIGKEEFNQLQLVPQGILNPWSCQAYQKIVEYINNLAKNLDDLLNMGRSGDQVTITLLILENFLEFAASGQRFMGSSRKPHYNPDDDSSWSHGTEDSNNNSYIEVPKHQDNFIGLLLPSFNSSADDNLHYYH